MASILQIVVVSVPLLYIVEDNPKATYFLRVSIIFTASQSILWLMFLPKVIAWMRGVTAADTKIKKTGLQGASQNGVETADAGPGVRFAESVAVSCFHS